jgi:two-component system, chemotaxis family, protein-glutamate methylesterase/glutaminase
MPGHDIIVIGASAGGVEALAELARGLPPHISASLLVVHHFPAHSTSVLPSILNRAGPVHAAHAQQNEPIRPSRIYVAPPNYHMIIKPGHVQLVRGPRENGHCPAIDPLFRSAALAYGPHVVGVILSGTLNDGSEGLRAVKTRGGVAIIQDPAEALYSGMPRSAMRNVAVDHVLRVPAMPPVLDQLARELVGEEETGSVSNEIEEVLVNNIIMDSVSSQGEAVSTESEGRAGGHSLPRG